MKISIITAAKNNKAGLLRAIECVRNQTYKNVEHIIIDGGSADGSQDILRSVQNYSLPNANYSLIAVSEADSGIYDAINKGIKLATGDVIGLLHSDDLYADENILEKYVSVFNQITTNNRLQTIDSVYSDLVYVRWKSDSGQAGMTKRAITSKQHPVYYTTIRYWKTQKIKFTTEAERHRALKNGWMPPHPTLFIRKEIFEKYGYYRTDMMIAADYEMILRLLYKHKITSYYLPVTTYLMSIGGASNKSVKNILLKSKEDYLAMKMNGINFPLLTLSSKNIRKLPQFLARDLS